MLRAGETLVPEALGMRRTVRLGPSIPAKERRASSVDHPVRRKYHNRQKFGRIHGARSPRFFDPPEG